MPNVPENVVKEFEDSLDADVEKWKADVKAHAEQQPESPKAKTDED